jgi:hypothetical protein
MKAWLRKGFLSDWSNAAVEDIRTGQIIDTPTVKATRIPGIGTALRVVPAGMISEIPEDFGIKSIVGPVFTVYAGEITIGLTGYTCSDTALTVTTATAYLGWDFNLDTLALTIVNFGSTFLRDPAHIRKWLYKVALNGTAVSVTRLGRLSGVFPANMG